MHRSASLVYHLIGPQTRECGCGGLSNLRCGRGHGGIVPGKIGIKRTHIELKKIVICSQWPECRYLGIISFLKLKISPQHIRPRLKYQMISLLHHVCFNII